MAKTIERRYIDPEHNILRTANNLYEYAKEAIENIHIIEKNEGIANAKELYKAPVQDLQESLVFGKVEAAAVLADLYQNGHGVRKNPNKELQYLYIGSQLGNKECQKLISEKILDQDVKKIGNYWIKAINITIKKYPNLDTEITYKMSTDSIELVKAIRLNKYEDSPKEVNFESSVNVPFTAYNNENNFTDSSDHKVKLGGKDSHGEDSSCCII